MTRLLIVRHGESEWNATRRVQGQSLLAGGLTELGERQARAAELRSAGVAPPFVAASDLPRALATAHVIAAELGVGVEVDAELREQNLGSFEGLFLDAPFDGGSVARALQRLWTDPAATPAGGESVLALQARVRAHVIAWALRFAGRDGVLVTHGGPVRVLRALGRPELMLVGRELEVGNASLTELVVDGELVRVLDAPR